MTMIPYWELPVFDPARWTRATATNTDLVGLQAAYESATLEQQIEESLAFRACSDFDLLDALLIMRDLGTYTLYINRSTQSTVQWGVFPYEPLSTFTENAGSAPAIVNEFYTWSATWSGSPASSVAAAQAIGAIPMVTWQPSCGGNPGVLSSGSISNVANIGSSITSLSIIAQSGHYFVAGQAGTFQLASSSTNVVTVQYTTCTYSNGIFTVSGLTLIAGTGSVTATTVTITGISGNGTTVTFTVGSTASLSNGSASFGGITGSFANLNGTSNTITIISSTQFTISSTLTGTMGGSPIVAQGSAATPIPGLTDITNGLWDTYINSFLTGAASCGSTVLLRFMHEFNGNWYPWDSPSVWTAAQFTAAWVYVWEKAQAAMAAAGTNNIEFVWCAAESGGHSPAGGQYPGDEYVSYLGFDGYNRSNQSWSAITDSFYATMTGISALPIIICEFATVEMMTGQTSPINSTKSVTNPSADNVTLSMLSGDAAGAALVSAFATLGAGAIGISDNGAGGIAEYQTVQSVTGTGPWTIVISNTGGGNNLSLDTASGTYTFFDQTAKPQWIEQTYAHIVSAQPQVAAACWFNGPGAGFSYPIESSPDATAAFAETVSTFPWVGAAA